MRDAALEDIKTIMNIDGFGKEEIKAKIRVLRSTYYQEKKKIQKSHRSGTGTDDLYRPNIIWYYDMDEIMTKIESKTPAWDSLDSQDQNSEQEQTAEAASSTDAENISSQRESAKTSNEPKSKKSKLNKMAAIVKDMQELSGKIEESEFDIFGSSVAAQLKKLSESQALLAHEQIQSILTRCRLNDVRSRPSLFNITSTSSTCSPIPTLSLLIPQPSPSSNFSTYSYSEPVQPDYEITVNTDNSYNESQEEAQLLQLQVPDSDNQENYQQTAQLRFSCANNVISQALNST